jgi:hypothetical protein
MWQIAITGWGEPLEILDRVTPMPQGAEVLVEVEVEVCRRARLGRLLRHGPRAAA